MSNYLSKHGRNVPTPQSEALPGQVPNSAGGHAFAVDDFIRTQRFLILGSEGGSYYASERDLTKENLDAVKRAIKKDGRRVVDLLLDVSLKGRAPKQSPTLYTLALCISIGDEATRQAAASAVPKICRTATMLFEFVNYAKANRGFGRVLRDAVANWYLGMDVNKLALQVVKYRNREGWTHRDMLRVSHPPKRTKFSDPDRDVRSAIFEFACKGALQAAAPEIIAGFRMAQLAEMSSETVRLITKFGLPRECVKPEHLNDPRVWDALLIDMPMTAMIRNLNKMTAVGLVKPLSVATKLIVAALQDPVIISKSRLHPISILAALRTYQQGHGEKGKLTWTPVQQVRDALEEAFYTAFGNVTPTGRNILLALDVSGSMTHGNVAGVPNLTPRDASAALALVLLKTEPNVATVCFSSCDGGWKYGMGRSMHSGYESCISPLNFGRCSTLHGAIEKVSYLPFGGTDCSLPMLYAEANKLDVDAFVVLTDSETWHGDIHPTQALQRYRKAMNKPKACEAVVAMVPNEFSIADPNDPGQLDVVGFDTATPDILAGFIRGEI